MPVIALEPGKAIPIAYDVLYQIINESSSEPGSYTVSFNEYSLMFSIPAGGTNDLKLTHPTQPGKPVLGNSGRVELGVATPGL